MIRSGHLFFFFLLAKIIYSQPLSLTRIDGWGGDSKPGFNDLICFSPDNKNLDYIIQGSADSLLFFQIGNDSNLQLIGKYPGKSKQCVNRDFAIYKNYLYAVADEGSSSLQIFDLNLLPGIIKPVYENDSLFANAHTCFVDSKKLYICSPKKGALLSPMMVFSLEKPDSPQLLYHIRPPVLAGNKLFSAVHDVYLRSDTGFLNCGNDGIFIYTFNDSNYRYQYSISQYPLSGFNHSGWGDSEGRYVYFTDENAGTGLKVLDRKAFPVPAVSKLINLGSGVIPHNPYVWDNLLLLSAYAAGIYMFDISLPGQPELLTRADTYSTPFSPGLNGCWSVVHGIKTKYIYGSDTHTGLHIFKIDTVLGFCTSDARDIKWKWAENGIIASVPVTIKILNLQGTIVFASENLQTQHSGIFIENGIYIIIMQDKRSENYIYKSGVFFN